MANTLARFHFREIPILLACLSLLWCLRRIFSHFVFLKEVWVIIITQRVSTDVYLCRRHTICCGAQEEKSEERNSSSPNTDYNHRVIRTMTTSSSLRDLMTRVFSPIINYGFLAFMEQAAVFWCPLYMPLRFLRRPCLDSFTIGIIMECFGHHRRHFVCGLISILLRRFGIDRLYRAAISMLPCHCWDYPLMNLLQTRWRVDDMCGSC